MSYWPRICPVCGDELPERGNRRVYVPWRRGFRLVHAGACFEAIEAQGVLEVSPSPMKLDVRTLRLMRHLAEQLPSEPVEARRHSPQELRALMQRLARGGDEQQLVRGPGGKQLADQRLTRAELVDLAKSAVLHEREVSASCRTDGVFGGLT